MIKYTYNFAALQKEDDITYYLLGAFCTDGCVVLQPGNKGSVILTSKDEDWAQSINNVVAPNKPLKMQSIYYRVEWHSIHIANWFIDHGCKPKKSLTLEFPNIPLEFLPDFIRGCWDGDGSLAIYKTKKYGTRLACVLTTGSKLFAESMRQKLLQLDIRSTIVGRTPPIRKIGNRTIFVCNTCYAVQLSDKKSIDNFCKIIYYDGHKISMNRKNAMSNLLKNECLSILT